jgi:hypothetical protein
MRVSAALITSLLPLALAGYTPASGSAIKPDPYEAVHQAESLLARTLDEKDYERLCYSLTEDVVYDSRPLGPDYGGLSVGYEQTVANIKAAFGTAKVAHHVSNAVIELNHDATQANVTT